MKAILEVADKVLPFSTSESKDKNKKYQRKNKEALHDEEGLVLEDVWDSDSKQTSIIKSEDDDNSYQLLCVKVDLLQMVATCNSITINFLLCTVFSEKCFNLLISKYY